MPDWLKKVSARGLVHLFLIIDSCLVEPLYVGLQWPGKGQILSS